MSEGASIRIAEKSWAPYAAIGLSLLLQLAVWAFWGGGMTQRVIALEAESVESSLERRQLSASISTQAAELAANRAQYMEIINRLNRIDNKLDQPVRIR